MDVDGMVKPRSGRPPRYGELTDAQRAQVIEARRRGFSADSIIEALAVDGFDISTTSLRNFLRSVGEW